MTEFTETNFLDRRLTMDTLKSALAYVDKMDWAVFPLNSIKDGQCTCSNKECKSPVKHPRLAGGFKVPTTDKCKINKWWSKWPYSNIGLATGEITGIIVMDIDPRNGGNESYDELISKHGALPETVEALSEGGGRHIWENLLKGVGQGQRNTLTGFLLRSYILEHVTNEIIQIWNDRNKPPLNKSELRAIVNSVAGKELGRRRRGCRRG